MSGRALFLDEAPGETRGVVLLDGRPERLLIERPGWAAAGRLGARSTARVGRIDRALATAFLELDGDGEGVLALTGAATSLTEGAAVEVEITAEARRGKAAVARMTGLAQGAPRLTQAGPALVERLRGYAPGAALTGGLEARRIADEAEAEALAVEHALACGGSLAIEPTRALIAVDVDLGAGTGEARRAAQKVNVAAIGSAARLLRLKSLGGLIVIDLVGRGQDGEALSAVAKAAFAADEPGVSIGPVNPFGLLVLAKPWRERPVREVLCGQDGGPSAATTGFRLLRALEREGWADRGARLIGRCSPQAAAEAQAYMSDLAGRAGARFSIEPDPALPTHAFEVRAA